MSRWPPVRAQDAATTEEARALFQEANALAAKGEHTRALERFRAAHALWPNPKILVTATPARI